MVADRRTFLQTTAGAAAVLALPRWTRAAAADAADLGPIVAEIDKLGFKDDFAAADFLLDEVGVAAVPGSSFYHRAELGHRKIRFTFSKSDETIAAAAERLGHLQEKLAARSKRGMSS